MQRGCWCISGLPHRYWSCRSACISREGAGPANPKAPASHAGPFAASCRSYRSARSPVGGAYSREKAGPANPKAQASHAGLFAASRRSYRFARSPVGAAYSREGAGPANTKPQASHAGPFAASRRFYRSTRSPVGAAYSGEGVIAGDSCVSYRGRARLSRKVRTFSRRMPAMPSTAKVHPSA